MNTKYWQLVLESSNSLSFLINFEDCLLTVISNISAIIIIAIFFTINFY